jgi:hypothetical protein
VRTYEKNRIIYLSSNTRCSFYNLERVQKKLRIREITILLLLPVGIHYHDGCCFGLGLCYHKLNSERNNFQAVPRGAVLNIPVGPLVYGVPQSSLPTGAVEGGAPSTFRIRSCSDSQKLAAIGFVHRCALRYTVSYET